MLWVEGMGMYPRKCITVSERKEVLNPISDWQGQTPESQ